MSDNAPPRRYGSAGIRPGYSAKSAYGASRAVHKTPSCSLRPHAGNNASEGDNSLLSSCDVEKIHRPPASRSAFSQFAPRAFSQFVRKPMSFTSPALECAPSHASSNGYAWTRSTVASTDRASTGGKLLSSSGGSVPSTPRVPSTDVSAPGDIDGVPVETTWCEKEDTDNWNGSFVGNALRPRVANVAAREAARRGTWSRIASTGPRTQAPLFSKTVQIATRRPPSHSPPQFHACHVRPSISPATTPQACASIPCPTTPNAVQRTSGAEGNREKHAAPRVVRPRIPVPIPTAIRTSKSPRMKFSAADQCTGGVLLRPETYRHGATEQPLAGCSRIAVCGMFHSGNHPTRDYALLFDENAQPRRRTRKHKWESDLEFSIGPGSPCGTPTEQWGAWKHRVPDKNWNVPRDVAVLCCVRDPLFFVPRLAQEPYSVEPAMLPEYKVKKGEKTKIGEGGRYLFEPVAIRPQWNSKYDSEAEWEFDNVAHLWRSYVHGFLTGQMCSSDDADRQRFFLVKLEDVQKRPKEIVDELVRLGLRLLEPHKPFAPLDKPAKKGCEERSKLIENNAPDKRWIAWENCPELVDILREEIDPALLEVLGYEPI